MATKRNRNTRRRKCSSSSSKSISLLMLVLVMVLTVLVSTITTVSAGTLVKGINSYSNASVEQLRKVTKGTRLSGYEQTILDAEKKYDVNALFICAVAKVETGMGNAGTGKSKNNAFGLTNGSGYARYDNIGVSVQEFARIINTKYFKNGKYTAYQIGNMYCPSNPSSWASKVDSALTELYKKCLN